MILVDTSIWVEHLRSEHAGLQHHLEDGRVLCHPWVVGELALGSLDDREEFLNLLQRLPQATVATPVEILTLIEQRGLGGSGIGYVDAQLLASAMISREASKLWTADRRLQRVASDLGYAFVP